jgi:hypothetical protein
MRPPTVRASASGASAPRAGSRGDSLLRALGVDPAFADDVLGDLAEEYARRAACDGAGAARWWYVREAVRAAPHLVASAIRHTVRHEPARLALYGGGVVVTSAVVGLVLAMREGVPVRLVAGARDGADGIVVNNVAPVQLPVRVLDEAGHLLKPNGVRYEWVSGTPLTVSPTGVVACTGRGDATVRASLGPLVTHVAVRCRPVREVESATFISLVAGEPARHLPFRAVGVDGRPVMQLRGAVRVVDRSVATLDGARIRPRAVGETSVTVNVGDRGARIAVIVHERVRAFTGLRPDQRLVAVPVRLARGDTVRWALPPGVLWLKYMPRREGERPPTISVEGPAACTAGDGLRVYRLPSDEYGIYCAVYTDGVTAVVAHGRTGAPVVEGWLALERVQHD